jgi:hypothetical protein
MFDGIMKKRENWFRDGYNAEFILVQGAVYV